MLSRIKEGVKPNSIFAPSRFFPADIDPESFPDSTTSSEGRKRFLDIAEGELRLINLTIENAINTIFFLDRSARPAYVLFREIWRNLMPEFPLPQVRFINVGMSNSSFVEEQLQTSSKKARVGKVLADTYKLPLQEKRILVADEYSDSGRSLRMAQTLIKAAYPQAKVLATGIYKDLPRWYGRMASLMGLTESYPIDKSTFFLSQREMYIYGVSMRGQFRKELSCLAELIAKHTLAYPIGSFPVEILGPQRIKNL